MIHMATLLLGGAGQSLYSCMDFKGFSKGQEAREAEKIGRDS